MAHVLVVEHDRGTRGELEAALSAAGHLVHCVDTTAEAVRTAAGRRPDLVVLGLCPPHRDAVEALGVLRATVRDVPVIVITGEAADGEVIRVLDAGADDYLVKPVRYGTLAARVRVVLRRSHGSRPSVTMVLGGLTIDLLSRVALLDGQPLPLSPKEFDLLAYMASRPGQVVSKRELLCEVWRATDREGDKTVDVHVSWLRRKLRESGKSPRYLHTVRGVGLRLDAPT